MTSHPHVVVAGAAGDLGGRVVRALVVAGARVSALVSLLRIAGDTLAVRDLAQLLTQISGDAYAPLRAGSIASLGLMIRVARLVAPRPGEPFPPWQGMQYMRERFSGAGKLHPLDNGRYGDRAWTSARSLLEGTV